MESKVILTSKQWIALIEQAEEKRDTYARIIANIALDRNKDRDDSDLLAQYSLWVGVHSALLNSEEVEDN